MIYYSESGIIVRIMRDADIEAIVKAEVEQGGQVSPEEFRCKLKNQEKLKNIVLVAVYKNEIVGYVNVRPLTLNGAFGGQGCSEIFGLKVLGPNRNLEIENKLMDIAEKVASEFSKIICLKVPLLDGETINKILKRGFLSHKSGMWYNDKVFAQCPDPKFDENLVLWFYKKFLLMNIHKFPVICTQERPSLRWLEDRLEAIYVHINFEKCEEVEVRDEVIIEDLSTNDYIIGKVIFKHRYNSFEDLMRAEGVKNILPFLKDDSINDDDIEKGAQYFKNFPGADLVEKYGCVALGIKVPDLIELKNSNLAEIV